MITNLFLRLITNLPTPTFAHWVWYEWRWKGNTITSALFKPEGGMWACHAAQGWSKREHTLILTNAMLYYESGITCGNCQALYHKWVP